MAVEAAFASPGKASGIGEDDPRDTVPENMTFAERKALAPAGFWREGAAPVVVGAHAKVNLCLDVLGKRADGLHEVATVLQTISLADRLHFCSDAALTLRCRGMDVAPDNLILRAARLLRERTGVAQGCAILCEKRIPIGAGLGGGSADAAATLRTLNGLWATGLSPEDLAALAEELGADVPFALRGGTALATGSGRTLVSLPDAPPHWLVLVPGSGGATRKTADMYAQLEPADFTDGSRARLVAAAIAQGRIDYLSVQSAFYRAVARRWPDARRARTALLASGAAAASVTGSGPSVFGLYPSRRAALNGYAQLRSAGLVALLRSFVPAADSSWGQPLQVGVAGFGDLGGEPGVAG